MNAEIVTFVVHVIYVRMIPKIHLPPEKMQIPEPEKLLIFRASVKPGKFRKGGNLGKEKVVLLFQIGYDFRKRHAFQHIDVFRGGAKGEDAPLRLLPLIFFQPCLLC